MDDHEQGRDHAAPADARFDQVADAGNLPSHVLATASVVSGDAEVVRVAPVEHRVGHEVEAGFRLASEQRPLDGRSERPTEYRGTLDVTGAGDRTKVTATRHTNAADDERITRGPGDTLTGLRPLAHPGRARPTSPRDRGATQSEAL